ncbi:hypothetical protein [Psychrobacter sp. AT9]|uniref:hypothetical protein n=1 Tax=Psychrobacter sp. AT9 TaxID=3242893 RepID=UPI0039A71074
MVKAQLKSKELERWHSSKDMYMMSYDNILDEVLEVLNGFVDSRNKSPSLITINQDFENTLNCHHQLYSFTSDFNPKHKPKTILSVPLKFKRNPDYDYVAE